MHKLVLLPVIFFCKIKFVSVFHPGYNLGAFISDKTWYTEMWVIKA